MRRVLVTGAAGFIGSHLVTALAAAGHEVIGVDNFDPFYRREDKERNLREVGALPGFAFHELDIRDPKALARLLTPETVVIHLAARAGVRPSIADPVGWCDFNVTATASVVEAMRAVGATELLFGSSSSVYGDDTPTPYREDATAICPVSPYASTKRAAELLLISMAPIVGLRVAALRFFTVFGPRQRPDLAIHAFARKLWRGETITLFGDGSQSRDYTYCDDIVAGILAALRWVPSAPNGTVEIFNLGGNRPVRLVTLVDTLSRALDRPAVTAWAPLPPGDVQHTWADLTKSGAVLGYQPRIPFEEGIARFAEWFRGVQVRD